MNTSKPTTTSFQLVVRWTARISSIPIIIVFLMMFVGEGFELAKVKPIEWVMLLFGPFGLALGMILGWWKEGLGGAITILSFLAALLVGDYSGSGAGYMLICASPGFLFLLSWFLSKSAGMSQETPVEENIPFSPPASEIASEALEKRKARLASGLCPKCGTQIKLSDKNCPSCRVNLAYANAHLDQL